MLIRKYRGKTLREALDLVRADLGGDATVLSTRNVRRGLLASGVEVTATIAERGPLHRPPAGGRATTPGALPAPRQPAPRRPAMDSASVSRLLSPVRQELRVLRSELRDLARQERGGRPEIRDLLQRLRSDSEELRQMVAALKEENGALKEALGGRATAAAGGDPLVRRLLDYGVPEAAAVELVSRVRSLPEANHGPGEAERAIAEALARRIPCSTPLELPGPRRVAALVGLPGAGKTTTLAKVAARAALLHGRAVGLVCCDADRIGALPAVEEIARAVDIPFRVARDAASLEEAVGQLADRDLILVDTGGRSAREPRSLAELRQMLHRAGAEAHLLLHAGMRHLEIDYHLRGFSVLPLRSLLFTHVDEALALGGIYAAVEASGLPLMYLTNGPAIPGDIEAATPSQVAALVMGLTIN